MSTCKYANGSRRKKKWKRNTITEEVSLERDVHSLDVDAEEGKGIKSLLNLPPYKNLLSTFYVPKVGRH